MPLLTCPDCGRQVSDVAPSCPGCGRPAAAPNYAAFAQPQAVAPVPKPGRFPKWIAVVGVAAFVVPVAIGFILSRSAGTTADHPSQTPVPVTAPTPAEDPDPTKTALIKMDTMTALGAFVFSKPLMADTVAADSGGSALFALWGARRMRWSDVYVQADETTFAKVRKDSSDQIGKRMCSAGQVVEIHAEKPATGGHVASGLLMSDSEHIYRFIAAGSSGDLGQDSRANFCGFVTGNYDYPNSMGGTGHAVTVVGMFDLPENRAAGR